MRGLPLFAILLPRFVTSGAVPPVQSSRIPWADLECEIVYCRILETVGKS